MIYAIFTRSKPRVMHAAKEGERQTLCRRDIGRGTDFVRDGDYRNNRPCPVCWPSTRPENRS